MLKNKSKLKVLGLFATAWLSLATFATVSAWGPDRATFTMERPATYPTFNSITNNPTIGDERDFVRIGEINAEVTDMINEVEVVPGRQYLVYIYYHNNASATFNDSAHDHSGVALKTRLATSFSTVLTPNEKGKVTATITAENANPASVWDEAYLTTKTEKVFLRYVAGSAKIRNDWGSNGWVMPSKLFTEEGAWLGLNNLNGIIPGCEEYHGIVTYVIQAEELGGSIGKTVSKDDTNFKKSVTLAPNESATYELTISNTGDVPLTNATIKDTLPDGLTLVPGSVKLRANASTTWDQLPDDIFTNGLNLGTIGTGNTIYVRYQVTAGDDFDCRGTELTNNATLTYDSDQAKGETKADSVTVTVTKTDCEEPDIPLDNCETNPGLPECQTCATNPNMEGCQELPDTGPVEIIMAIIVLAGIGGGIYYLYHTKKTLRTVEEDITGPNDKKDNDQSSPEA